MQTQFHYATVSEAINNLRNQGFTADFRIEENHIVCSNGKFSAGEFDVVDVYRYEGNSDPGDEAVVYAIQSSSGLKGVLVTGYGAYSGNASPEILKKLREYNRTDK